MPDIGAGLDTLATIVIVVPLCFVGLVAAFIVAIFGTQHDPVHKH